MNELLASIPNPDPAEAIKFGSSVAAVGDDRVLVGAHDGLARNQGGVAYLFTAEGSLLTTLRKPDARPLDLFGWAVAVLDSSKFYRTTSE